MTSREAQRRRIYARDQGVCRRCGKHTPYEGMDLGHIIARVHGGGREDSNLSVEHKSCNRRAGSRMVRPGASGLPRAEVGRW